MPASHDDLLMHYHNQNSLFLFKVQALFLNMEKIGEKKLLETLEKLEKEAER